MAQPTRNVDWGSNITAVDLGRSNFLTRSERSRCEDGERAANTSSRVLLVAISCRLMPSRRASPKWARLACQHLVDVGQRPAEILLRVVDWWRGGSGLDEHTAMVDDGIEQLDREIELLRLGRGT